ncbi:hypothetical protein [Psychroserpens mesophilus]|uniref:hypothetical protein n=1 Tax=Psychroserpens mesophilus TaxID=325473 RepID=UPI003D65E7E8
MKSRLICFVICLILVNCKEPKPKLTFKYSNDPALITCGNDNSKLLNEAVYNFEANLVEHYTNENTNLYSAYRMFLKESANNTANYNNISNQHSIDVFEALKNIEGLWIIKNNKLSLNYKHDIFNCIGENISDKDLKTTFNALLETNSMSIRMLKDVLLTKSNRLNTDKYLATFVALELYYSKLSDVDLSKKQEKTSDAKLKEKNDPHAGHNHD